MYLGNFGRKPSHQYYTANKHKVQNGLATGRTYSAIRAQPSKRRDAHGSTITSATTTASAQNMIRIPQNLRHMVNQHNATAINFFETERLSHMLNKAKTMLGSHIQQLDGVEVRRVKGKKSRHLIEITFSNALVQSMHPQKYSKLLQTLIPQHQL